MKARLLVITSLLISIVFMAGCSSDTPMQQLKTASQEIDKIEKRSENIKNKEEAFTLLRDLNQELKDIKNAALALDEKVMNGIDTANYEMYKPNGNDAFNQLEESDFKSKQHYEDYKNNVKQFEKFNADINSSLAVISKNLEPFKDDEEVSKMLEKLQGIMIKR